MIVLTIDVGGSHVKVLTSDRRESRKADSGDAMTPAAMIDAVREMTTDWHYDAVTIGYPGVVQRGRITKEPTNLGRGWTAFDFQAAFGCPVTIINDAAMQALGSYNGGTMLFLGLGTGLGAAMIIDDIIQPLELAHLPYRKHRTYEEYLGEAGHDRLGEKKWKKHVWRVVELFRAALQPEYIVIGGGNVNRLHALPEHVLRGDNDNAFTGGFRLWQPPYHSTSGSTP
ncbi:MAG TPA: ROK family protein [Gemmatimonadales bacterium]|nr:ROK family protein [Gemmatimonadales bacterium]